MRLSRSALATGAVGLTVASFAFAAAPAPASAGIPGGICKAAGDANGLAGKACDALSNPGKLLNIGKNLITGHIGSAFNDFLDGGGAASASTALSLAAIVAWVYEGAKAALHEMGKYVSESAAPQLGSVWFSSTYWRMAGVGALLTVPFLFAAAVQAVGRSDLALLGRAAFGHLPLALVGVGIAAPITMLLLSGTDELCGLVWSPSSSNGLIHSAEIAGVASLIGAPFLAFLLFLFTAAGAVVVWLELAMREAAVYIVVLLLPLVFAALVWPARRIWAVRAIELLAALILSKFAIVAVLGLGGTALENAPSGGLDAVLAGMVLVLLAAFAPWAVLRLVPLTELASSAAGAFRPHARASIRETMELQAHADKAISGIAGHIADLAMSSTERARAPKANTSGRADEWRSSVANAGGPERREEADALAGAPVGAAQGFEDDLAARAGAAIGDVGDIDGAGYTGDMNSDNAAREERVPGAEALWQAPDLAWRPLTLGPDEGWPPDPVWPGDDAAASGSEVGLQGSSGPTRPDLSGGARGPGGIRTGAGRGAPDAPGPSSAEEGGGEQSDPLPPLQDRGGPL